MHPFLGNMGLSLHKPNMSKHGKHWLTLMFKARRSHLRPDLPVEPADVTTMGVSVVAIVVPLVLLCCHGCAEVSMTTVARVSYSPVVCVPWTCSSGSPREWGVCIV